MDERTQAHEALLYEYVLGERAQGLSRWHEPYRVGFERSAYASWWFEELGTVFPRTARALRRVLDDQELARLRLKMSAGKSSAQRRVHYRGLVEGLCAELEHGGLLRDLIAYESAIARVRGQPALGRGSLSRRASEPEAGRGAIAELELVTTLPEILAMAASPEELLELYADYRPRRAAVYHDAPLGGHVLVTFDSREELAAKILFGRVP